MPYCRECGTKLPDDEETIFCPNCGAAIQPVSRIARTEVSRVSKRRTSRTERSIVIAIFLCLIVTFFGAVLPVDPSEAEETSKEIDRIRGAMSTFGVATIFGNNLMHGLAMFTPFIGPFYGFYVLFSTGRVIAALASAQGVSSVQLFVSIFILPHAWIEYISYGLAVSESFWLTLAVIRRRFRDELPNAWKAISTCALMLLLAAFIEAYMILILG